MRTKILSKIVLKFRESRIKKCVDESKILNIIWPQCSDVIGQTCEKMFWPDDSGNDVHDWSGGKFKISIKSTDNIKK